MFESLPGFQADWEFGECSPEEERRAAEGIEMVIVNARFTASVSISRGEGSLSGWGGDQCGKAKLHGRAVNHQCCCSNISHAGAVLLVPTRSPEPANQFSHQSACRFTSPSSCRIMTRKGEWCTTAAAAPPQRALHASTTSTFDAVRAQATPRTRERWQSSGSPFCKLRGRGWPTGLHRN
jgi:hypothetical protein